MDSINLAPSATAPLGASAANGAPPERAPVRRRRSRVPVRLVASCAALALTLARPAPIAAQRVLGIGEDATIPDAGTLRLRVGVEWTRFNERFGRPDSSGGRLQRLGAAFAPDTLGVRQVAVLAPLRDELRTLADIPSLGLSLGSPTADAEATVVRIPIDIELGLGRRLSLVARVPVVNSRVDVVFDPRGRAPGNVGLNPAFTNSAFRKANAALVTQLAAARTRLQAALATCAASATTAQCTAVNANRANAQALLAATSAFAAGVAAVYGTDSVTGSPFVPVAGSSAQRAIEGRAAALNSLYRAYLGLGASDANPIAGVPAGAPTVMSLGDIQTALTDSAFGYALDSLTTVQRVGVGDIEIGAKFLLLDTFGSRAPGATPPRRVALRTAVGALVRLSTGKPPSPDNLVDIGTGDGQTDVEGRAVSDIFVGRRFWASAVARVGIQLPDRRTERVPDFVGELLVPLSRRGVVDRKLGDYVELEVTPRYVFGNSLAVAAQYGFRHKGADRYSGTFPGTDPSGAAADVNASALDGPGATTEHRFGAGVVFSTLSAYTAGRARLPLEVSYTHFQTLAGSGGQPKRFVTRLELRVFPRFFGPGRQR